jgi:hypothetical protein
MEEPEQKAEPLLIVVEPEIDGHQMDAMQVLEAVHEINDIATNARQKIGAKVDALRKCDNWKAINSIRGEEKQYKSWNEFCAGEFPNMPRQDVERCRVEYITANKLPVRLTNGLKPAHLRALADLPEEQRVPVLTQVVNTVPQTQHGRQFTTSHILETAQQLFPTPPPDLHKFVQQTSQETKEVVPEPSENLVNTEQALHRHVANIRPLTISFRQMLGWIEQALASGEPTALTQACQNCKDEILSRPEYKPE